MKKTTVFLFTFLLITNLAFGYTLPVPTNTVKESEQALDINNIPYTTQAYLSQLSLEEAASFYKENLPKQGFALVNEYEETHTLIFSNPAFNDNLAILIENAPENKVSIKISSWHGELITTKEQVDKLDLTKDAPGNDVPGVPRYPGSIRVSAVSFSGMKNASYMSQDEKEKILSFYETEMPAQGWKNHGVGDLAKQKAADLLGGNNGLAQSEFLFFEKKDNFCGILITEAGAGAKGNMVGILLIPKPKEPLRRE